MNYIKKFEDYIPKWWNPPDIRKSSNPIYYIEKSELEDIMCYLTDQFEYKLSIYNDKVIVNKSLEKKVVTIYCTLNVSDDRIDDFENQLKNVMSRIYSITGRTFGIYVSDETLRINSGIIHVKIKIDDCRLEE